MQLLARCSRAQKLLFRKPWEIVVFSARTARNCQEPCLVRALPARWSSSLSNLASSPQTLRRRQPSLLWAPGDKSTEAETDHFAREIGTRLRGGNKVCMVGARGQLPTARAMRAFAQASESGLSTIELQVRWHVDEGDEKSRSLRLYASLGDTWRNFKKGWVALSDKPAVVPVTPHTKVRELATAVSAEQRKKGGVALRLNPSSDEVLAIAAKALATLPLVAQTRTQGNALVAVMRWPELQTRAGEEAAPGAKFVYVHVQPKAKGSGEPPAVQVAGAVAPQKTQPNDTDSWAKRTIG